MVYQYFHGGICFCHCDRMVLPGTAGNRRSVSFSRIYPVLFFRSSICRRLYQAGSSMDAVGSVEWTDGIFNLTALLFLTGEVEYPDRYI